MSNDSISELKKSVSDLESAVREKGIWFIIVGFLLTILGILAIAMPVYSSIAAKTVIGWLMMFGGFALVFHGFVADGWKNILGSLIIGILYIIAGGYLVFNIFDGLLSVTIALGAVFMTEGVIKIYMSFKYRPADGWGWVLADGIASLVLGGLLLYGLPDTAAWSLGVLVGINLMVSGMVMAMLGFAARS